MKLCASQNTDKNFYNINLQAKYQINKMKCTFLYKCKLQGYFFFDIPCAKFAI